MVGISASWHQQYAGDAKSPRRTWHRQEAPNSAVKPAAIASRDSWIRVFTLQLQAVSNPGASEPLPVQVALLLRTVYCLY